MSKRRNTRSLMFPEIQGPVAGSFVIQRGGPEQTGKKDAQWLTPETTWSRNIFMAARFELHERALAESCLAEATARNLPVLSREQELAIA